MNELKTWRMKLGWPALLLISYNYIQPIRCLQLFPAVYTSAGDKLLYKNFNNFNSFVNENMALEEEIYSQSSESNTATENMKDDQTMIDVSWSNKTNSKQKEKFNFKKLRKPFVSPKPFRGTERSVKQHFTFKTAHYKLLNSFKEDFNTSHKDTYLLGFSGNPFWIHEISSNQEKVSSMQTNMPRDPRKKRSALHLYNMVLCTTGCNPFAYKGYGCYCGFLGSGYAVDGIDSCCQVHDRCYNTAGCPMFFEYFIPYLWKCYSHQPFCGWSVLSNTEPLKLVNMTKNILQKNEQIREEFITMVEDEGKLMMTLQKEEAAALMRQRKDFVRRLELERREASLNGIVLKAQEVANLQKNQLEQEEKLAVELNSLRRKEILDEKLRLHLRQNSEELKVLESQLKAAYVKKAIAAQLAEKEAKKLEEEVREKRAREIIEKAVGTQEEQEVTQRLAEKKKKDAFKYSLQDQIIQKEKLKQLEYMSFMKEKKMFDDIVQKIKEEEENELQAKRALQNKLKEEMKQFYTARAMWKAKERLVIQEEEEKIKEICEKKENEKITAKIKAAEKMLAKQKASDKLFKEFKEKQKKKEEAEEIMSSLMKNEIEEKENKKAQEEKKREVARREEAKMAYKQILEEKNQRKQREKELERQFVQQMKLKMEEEDKAEKAKQEKRRQDQINNLKYNKEAMRQNVQKRAESLKLTHLVNELTDKEEARKAQLVQEERLIILREHVPKLLGYFPKGCLQEKDLEALGIVKNFPLPESCPLENRQP